MVYKMPFVLEKKYDHFYKKGWNEAWSEAWSEAKIEDAITMIKKFNLPIEEVVKTLNIDKNKLLQRINNER